jgi:hypothetical protein
MASYNVKNDKQFYLVYVGEKLTEIYNVLFRVVFRLLLRKMITIALGLQTGVSVLNRMSSSGDAFLRGRLRCPDDMNYEGYLEFRREILPLYILQSRKSEISVDRVFFHRYLGFTSVAITDIAQVAHKESSLSVKSS